MIGFTRITNTLQITDINFVKSQFVFENALSIIFENVELDNSIVESGALPYSSVHNHLNTSITIARSKVKFFFLIIPMQ